MGDQHWSRQTGRAGAGVGVHAVGAGAAILAGVRVALVDVGLQARGVEVTQDRHTGFAGQRPAVPVNGCML